MIFLQPPALYVCSIIRVCIAALLEDPRQASYLIGVVVAVEMFYQAL